jgi:hypothetical protein
MDNKSIVGNAVVPEMVKYWKWIDSELLGIVGSNSVYHISVSNIKDGNNQLTAEKMCDRQGDLTGQNGPVQIIGYNYGIDGTFCSLIALGRENNQIVGKI